MSYFYKNNYKYSVCLLIIAMISIQSSGSFAKVLFQSHDVIVVATMRLLLATCILALFSKLWTIKLKQIKWSMVIGYGLALGSMNGLFYLSLERLPLGIAVSFEFIGPLGVALLHAKKKLDYFWVCLAIIGMLFLFPFQQTTHTLDVIGVCYALGAGLCWAIYILTGQKPSGISNQHTVSLGMAFGSLLLLPFAVATGTLDSIFHLNTLGYFFVLAILASALPYTLEMVALRNMSPFIFGTLTSLEPAIAALSGFIFLNEHLLINQWIALSTIIIASVGCSYSTQRSQQNTIL